VKKPGTEIKLPAGRLSKGGGRAVAFYFLEYPLYFHFLILHPVARVH